MIGVAMKIVLAPQFTVARFNRSLAGSTAPIDRPGASRYLSNRSSCVHWRFQPILLSFVSAAARAAAVSVWPGMRTRSVRWEARCDRGKNMRLEPRPETDQTIQSHL